ncbi:hypothetical protein [Paenibacillus sp. sptzw28]|uniref:hypothetical protein n=1 Tax=Paenibacillus sp. sptzw28 TaxID=715179 RepID=UPI002161B9FB|nr:hypothetical protein [Paenibacillus sp. sptzw28]
MGERTIGDVLTFEDERFAATDTFEQLREGLVQWTRKFTYRGESPAACKLSILLPFDVSEWLVAWPTAFRLEVLRRVGPELLGT